MEVLYKYLLGFGIIFSFLLTTIVVFTILHWNKDTNNNTNSNNLEPNLIFVTAAATQEINILSPPNQLDDFILRPGELVFLQFQTRNIENNIYQVGNSGEFIKTDQKYPANIIVQHGTRYQNTMFFVTNNNGFINSFQFQGLKLSTNNNDVVGNTLILNANGEWETVEFKLNELLDVQTSTAVDGQIIYYDNGEWKPADLPPVGGITFQTITNSSFSGNKYIVPALTSRLKSIYSIDITTLNNEIELPQISVANYGSIQTFMSNSTSVIPVKFIPNPSDTIDTGIEPTIANQFQSINFISSPTGWLIA